MVKRSDDTAWDTDETHFQLRDDTSPMCGGSFSKWRSTVIKRNVTCDLCKQTDVYKNTLEIYAHRSITNFEYAIGERATALLDRLIEIQKIDDSVKGPIKHTIDTCQSILAEELMQLLMDSREKAGTKAPLITPRIRWTEQTLKECAEEFQCSECGSGSIEIDDLCPLRNSLLCSCGHEISIQAGIEALW